MTIKPWWFVEKRGLKLDFGCDTDHIEGFKRVDCNYAVKPDFLIDLNKFPYPLDDGCASHIRASHVLEHLSDPERAIYEFHRILGVGGHLLIKVPHRSSSTAFMGHPQHKQVFSSDFMTFYRHLFDFKTRLNWMKKTQKSKYYVIKWLIALPIDLLANVNIRIAERLWLYYVGGFEEIEVNAIKK